MKNQQEIWKTVVGKENYEVSNFGNVRRKEYIKTYEKISKHGVKFTVNQKFKAQVMKTPIHNLNDPSSNTLYKTCLGTLVHRLVAKTFIPNLENKKEVNHKDGNGLNNNLDNLEWVTNSENQKHSYKNGFRKVNKKCLITGRWLKTRK